MIIKRKMTFDPKCLELAEYFLEEEAGMGNKADLNDLAAEIQNTVENWVERARSFNEPQQDPPEGT